MSEFHIINVVFKDESILVKSLEELGYSPSIHKEGVVLAGNYNRNKVKANVIIPRSQFGGNYGDVGFEKTKKGYVMHADNLDIKKFNLKGLNHKYGENKLKNFINKTSKYNIISRKENKNGQLEIHIRVQ